MTLRPAERHTESLAAQLAQHPVFRVLPDGVLDDLGREAITRSYPRGHHIWQPGDLTAHVGVIQDGLVAIIDQDVRGNSYAAMVKGSGDLLAPFITMNQIVQYGWTTALLDAELILIPKADFERMFRSYPDFAAGLIAYASEILARFRKTMIRRISMPATSRIADFLLEGYERASATGSHTIPALSHKDLAMVLGTSRETVTRTLHQLESAKLIAVERRQITVLNPTGLREVAQS